MTKNTTRRDFEHYALSMLDDESLEDFMERYDLEPVEVVMLLYDAGLIDMAYEDFADEDTDEF